MQKKYTLAYALLVLIAVTHLNCIAQQKSVVKKVYAFYTENLPGNIPVDRNGKPIVIQPDTVITVYIEATTKMIKWDTAWFKGHSFLIVDQNIVQDTVDVGITKEGQQKIVLTAAKNNFILQLYLQKLEAIKKPPQKNKKEILLKGNYKGKIFYQKVGAPVQIESIPAV